MDRTVKWRYVFFLNIYGFEVLNCLIGVTRSPFMQEHKIWGTCWSWSTPELLMLYLKMLRYNLEIIWEFSSVDRIPELRKWQRQCIEIMKKFKDRNLEQQLKRILFCLNMRHTVWLWRCMWTTCSVWVTADKSSTRICFATRAGRNVGWCEIFKTDDAWIHGTSCTRNNGKKGKQRVRLAGLFPGQLSLCRFPVR